MNKTREEFNETVARNVQALLDEHSMNQKKLSELSGIDDGIISNIVNNKYSKKVDSFYIEQIAKAFGVNSDAITESNVRVKELIAFLEKNVFVVPATQETLDASDELLQLSEKLATREKALAHLYKGLIFYYESEYALATERYEKAHSLAYVSRCPDLLWRVRRNLSSALMMVGMYERAQEFIAIVLSDTPDDAYRERAEELYKLAVIYRSKGQLGKMENLLSNALELAMKDSTAIEVTLNCMMGLSYFHNAQGQTDMSFEFSNKVVVLGTDHGILVPVLYAYKSIGEYHRNHSKNDKALKSFEDGLALSTIIKRDFESLLLRYEIAATIEDYEDMKEVCSKLDISKYPPHQIVSLFERTAKIAYQRGNIDDLYVLTQKICELLKKK